MTQFNQPFCSQLSQYAGEQIFGTATETTVWLVLAYNRPWGAKALEESELPAAVKAQLAHWQNTLPGARLQFIKQSAHDDITFFVGIASEQAARLYRFSLASYEELLALDVRALLDNAAAYVAFQHDEPLFLVCTNGRRDLCCAKWGMPVYQALAAYAGRQVWQTTHTGGHRFAATLICLPQGISYGRVEVGEAQRLVDAYRQGQIYQIDRYRGRTCYDTVTQAADGFLREQTGDYAFAAFQHLATQQLDQERWHVQFRAQQDQQIHQLVLQSTLSTFENPQSCNKQAGERVRQFALSHYDTRRNE